MDACIKTSYDSCKDFMTLSEDVKDACWGRASQSRGDGPEEASGRSCPSCPRAGP